MTTYCIHITLVRHISTPLQHNYHFAVYTPSPHCTTLHQHYTTNTTHLTVHFHVTYQILQHFSGHTHRHTHHTLFSHFTTSTHQHHLIGLSAHSLHNQWISPATPSMRKLSSSMTSPWWMHSMFRTQAVRLSSDSWLSATLSCLKKKMVNLSVLYPDKMNMEVLFVMEVLLMTLRDRYVAGRTIPSLFQHFMRSD